MKRFSYIVLIAWSAVGPLFGQQGSNRSDELIGTSGAPGFVHLLPGLYRPMLWSLSKPPSREAERALISMTEAAFAPDTTIQRLRLACDSRYNPEVFDGIIAWFRSPLGLKVASAERSLATIGDKNQGTLREQVRSQWVSQRRMLLLLRLDKNLSFGTREGIFALTLLEDIANVQPAGTPGSEVESGELIAQRLDRATTRLESTLRDSVLFDLRVLYRSLSNDDLQNYNEFLESFPGRWYTDILGQGLEDAFLEGRTVFLERAGALGASFRKSFVP